MTAKTKRVITAISFIVILSVALLLSVAYIQYRDFKKAFISKLSAQATSFIGQEVSVDDLSFSPAGAIALQNIIVHNPEGFTAGKLLTIEKLSLKMHYREILKKKLFFEKITVHAPELTFIRNRDGKLNISDKLREFFARKPTLNYRIDEFTITSGVVDFNGDKKFRNDDVNVSLKNLSSERDTKTSISGHTTYAGSRIAIDGWAYLKNEPKRLNISISSQDLSLSALKESLNTYGVEITKTKASLYLNAEGDTQKGFHFTSEIGIKDARFAFLKKDIKEMLLKIHAFLDIRDKTILIDNASLNAGGGTAVTLQGELKDIQKDLSYTARLKIKGLDLSAINFTKDMNIAGILNSDDLQVQGSYKKPFPALSGSLELRDGLFQARDFAAGHINADIKFSAGDAATFSFAMKDLKYRNHTIPWLRAKSEIVYHDNIISMKAPDIQSADFTASANNFTIKLPLKKSGDGVRIEMKDIHASYPAKGTGTTNADLSMTLNKDRNVFSGDFGFSAREVMLKEMRAGFIKGSGSFNEKNYSVDISQADISGGRIRIAAEGRTSGDIFPIKIKSSADNINIESLYSNISKIVSISYPQSGHIQKAVFEATIESSGAVQGSADVQAEKITIPVANKKRTIIKDGILKAGIKFKGKDLDFTGDAKAGKLSARISGSVNGFSNRDRLIMVHLSFPEVKALDVRETFWDIFPDSLLYTGMDGSLTADISIRYDASALEVNGKLLLGDLVLNGENGEYSVGPMRGVLPVVYTQGNDTMSPPELPSFEQGEFKNTSHYYAEQKRDDSYNLISLGTVSYGFQLLDNVNLWVRPEGKFMHIGYFSGNIFGGKLHGSGIMNLADKFQYKAGFLLEGLSLTQLCERIEPIKGYISGKVNGTATVKGSGAGLSQLIGKADFWTYGTKDEKTKISKEFLHKVGGPSLKMYLGDRNFDRGIMSLYLQNGFVIFRELEISNRNFIGIKDLDMKVAPLNNRIAIDHLMWSITEAAFRAKNKE
jgi:hypothetical protein